MTTLHPRRIVLIRHAEKTGRPGDRGLSPRGWARAIVLVSALPTRFGAPTVIVACANTPKSTRPVDTVRPLADALGLPIEDRWDTKDAEALATTLQADGKFAGQNVLICWRHDTLPALARALGVDAPCWSSADYESVWIIEPGGERPSFRIARQDLELLQPFPGAQR